MPALIRPILFVTVLTLPLCWGDEPQMTWEGPLKKKADIGFGRNRVVIGCRTCANFRQLLPAKEQTVRAELVQGQGTVKLIEHPIHENLYHVLALFEPRVKGEQVVRIHFYWDPSPPSPEEAAAAAARRLAAEAAEVRAAEAAEAEPSGLEPVRTPGISGSSGSVAPAVGGLLGGIARGVLLGQAQPKGANRITWSGRVDGTILVRCRDLSCGTKNIEGRGVSNAQHHFGAPLPAARLEILMAVIEGRGEVAITEQPDAGNQYTVTFEINDVAAKAGDYRLELTWRK